MTAAHNGGGEMGALKYGSVCSGIEAASVAWHPLGWAPAWFAEIEPFPSAVLAHHWPTVPNLGDFTAIRDKVAAGEVDAPDILVGGTPCQAFSVAGLRQSLDDKRGQLTLEFVRLANAIDSARSLRGKRPVTVVWENVPGVLNTPDNAFGCFLGALAGAEDEIFPGDRPGHGKSSRVWRWDRKAGKHFPVWPVRGVVSGPARTLAWRVLDAQWFGVAQRRRRVFVVASAGGIRPESVLFELDGVRRDSAPRREAGQGTTHDVAPCLTSGGRGVERIGDTRGQDPVVAVPDVIGTLTKQFGNQSMGAPEVDAGLYLPVSATGDVFHTLRAEGFDASEDGTGRGAGAVAVAFTSKDYGSDAVEGIAPTMRSMGHNESHANGGGQLAVAFGVSESPDLGHCLRSGASKADKHESTTYVQTGMQVRRLTPKECERLQGFPDGHTLIPWRGKGADDCPDGPRYKALGNSMAVPVMRWIGARIARQLEAQP